MIVWCGDNAPHTEHDDCPGFADEHVMPTDEQWLGMLRGMPDDEALARVNLVRRDLEQGFMCFMGNHASRVADLVTIQSKVADLSNWIDGSYPPDLDREAHLRRRTDKVASEAGEVIDAVGGYVGENPRKGVTNGMDKVEYELLDAATASLGALFHVTDGCDVVRRLAEHVDTVWHRAGLNEEEAPDGVAE